MPLQSASEDLSFEFKHEAGMPASLVVRTAEGAVGDTWVAMSRGPRRLHMASWAHWTNFERCLAPGERVLHPHFDDVFREMAESGKAEDPRYHANDAIPVLQRLLASEHVPAVVAFMDVCGRSTVRAFAAGNVLSNLRRLDKAVGFGSVEAFFRRWPVLQDYLAGHDREHDRYHRDIFGLRTPFSRSRSSVVADIIRAGDDRGAVARLLADLVFRRSLRYRPFLLGAPRCREIDLSGLDPSEMQAAATVLLKRMRGVAADCPELEDLLAFASKMPADWLPSGSSVFEAFADAATAMRTLDFHVGHTLDMRALAGPSKGRWVEFAPRLQALADARLGGDVQDMVNAFMDRVGRPLFMHAIGIDGEMPVLDAVASAFDLMSREGAPQRTMLKRFCVRLLFADMGAPAVVAASDAWHRIPGGLNWAGLLSGVRSSMSWAVPFVRIEVSPGVALVAITDSAGLSAEGLEMKHCVGGYSSDCSSRRSVVASLRRTGIAGVVRASSTVELSGWQPGAKWAPLIRQHRSVGNRDPSDEDVAAVEAALAAWNEAGGIAADLPGGGTVEAPSFRDDPDLGRGAAAGIWCLAGYDWRARTYLEAAIVDWHRFLPREIRGGGAEALVARIDVLCGEGSLAYLRSSAARMVDAAAAAASKAERTRAVRDRLKRVTVGVMGVASACRMLPLRFRAST